MNEVTMCDKEGDLFFKEEIESTDCPTQCV